MSSSPHSLVEDLAAAEAAGAAPSPSDAAEEASIFDQLNPLLGLAAEGRIKAFALVALGGGEDEGSFHTVYGGANHGVMTLIGGIETIKAELLLGQVDGILPSKGEEPKRRPKRRPRGRSTEDFSQQGPGL